MWVLVGIVVAQFYTSIVACIGNAYEREDARTLRLVCIHKTNNQLIVNRCLLALSYCKNPIANHNDLNKSQKHILQADKP